MSVSYNEPSASEWERFDRDRSAERSPLSISFEFFPQPRHDTVRRLYVLDREPVREIVDPGDLQAHGGVEGGRPSYAPTILLKYLAPRLVST